MAENEIEDKNGISEYQFKDFNSSINKDGNCGEVLDFNFEDLATTVLKNKSIKPKNLKIEMAYAKRESFRFADEVYEHRGLKKHKEEEEEARINSEIQVRVVKIEAAAKERGYEEGIKIGREEVYNETRALADEKIATLSLMISDVLKGQADIMRKQRDEIYVLVKNLTKWVVLRELKDDGEYLNRLLEKLITELDNKANLQIQVNQKEFEKMPEILESVQAKLGELPNVRVEVDYDIESDGFIVQSENGIINGSMEKQFEILEGLFEQNDE